VMTLRRSIHLINMVTKMYNQFWRMILISVIGVILLGRVRSWSVLPGATDWPAILGSFDSADDIEPYVKVYVAPFWELQRAERDETISDERIKSSMQAAATLFINVTGSFKMEEEDFAAHDPVRFSSALERAVKVFEDADNRFVAALAPVFEPRTLRRFLFQRMDDLLINSVNEDQMEQRLTDLRQYLGFWRVHMHGWAPERFRNLIPRNLDLVEVSRYISRRLRSRFDSELTLDEVRELRYELHALGNGHLRIFTAIGLISASLVCAIILL
jgi:hypothetical protein